MCRIKYMAIGLCLMFSCMVWRANAQIQITGDGPDIEVLYQYVVRTGLEGQVEVHMPMKLLRKQDNFRMELTTQGTGQKIGNTSVALRKLDQQGGMVIVFNENEQTYSRTVSTAPVYPWKAEEFSIQVLGEAKMHELDCDLVEATHASGLRFLYWVTRKFTLYEAVMDLYNLSREQYSDPIWAAMRAEGVYGTIVRMEQTANDGTGMVMDLVSVKRGHLPETLFQVPPNYKEIELAY